MAESQVPTDHGSANPFFEIAANLVANIDEYRAIAREIQRYNVGDGGSADIRKVMAACDAAGLREKLRVLFNQSRDLPPTPPVMEVPPTPAEVYGRFSRGVRVIDVGTGNGSKIKKYTGVLKFTCLDPVLNCPCTFTVTRAVMPLSLYMPQITGDPIFSSFMSVCQLPREEQDLLFTHDGLHLIPNHETLCAVGAAKRVSNKIVVHTPAKDWEDEPVPDMGYEVQPGYNLLMTFKQRRLEVKLGLPVEQRYCAESSATPVGFEELNISDLGYKWDGEFHEMECREGIACMVNRSGLQQLGEINFKDHMCLHLEKLGSCYVLLRIMAYRGAIPPHCGETLRRFAESVKITIDGKPICGPPPWRTDRKGLLSWYDDDGNTTIYEAPVDGIISRREGKDFYCKYQWTIDVADSQVPSIIDKLHDAGMTAKFDVRAGLWEYAVDREQHVLEFRPLRRREDKLRPTSMDSILLLVSKPTLKERVTFG